MYLTQGNDYAKYRSSVTITDNINFIEKCLTTSEDTS